MRPTRHCPLSSLHLPARALIAVAQLGRRLLHHAVVPAPNVRRYTRPAAPQSPTLLAAARPSLDKTPELAGHHFTASLHVHDRRQSPRNASPGRRQRCPACGGPPEECLLTRTPRPQSCPATLEACVSAPASGLDQGRVRDGPGR